MKKNFFTSLKYWHILIMLLLLACSLRIGRSLIVDRISKDGVLYVQMAENVKNGERSEAFIENRRMPPLYILMITFVSNLGVSLESAAMAISIVAGFMMVLPLFLVVRMFFGTKIAAFSGLLIAVHPSLVRISSTIMRDSLFLSLFLFSFASILFAIQKNRLLFWGLGGFFAALATATRAEGFEIITALILWMIVDLIMKKRNEKQFKIADIWRQTLSGPLIFILLFFITSQPIVNAVKGTSSTWSVVDTRIIGYIKGFFSNSSEDVLKTEDTL